MLISFNSSWHFAEESELERVPDPLQEMDALGHGDGENVAGELGVKDLIRHRPGEHDVGGLVIMDVELSLGEGNEHVDFPFLCLCR